MHLPPALANPIFRRYVTGNFFALQSNWAQRAIVGWLAWDLSGSAGWVGTIAFLSFAPSFVSGPVFGAIADRSDLRRAALIAQNMLALISLALFLALALGVLTLPVLSALALAQGVTISAHHPIRLALTPRLAPRDALGNAIAISSLNFNLARLTGPAAGGYAVAHLGAATAQALVALFALPAIAVLLSIRPQPPAARTGEEEAGLIAALVEGARYTWGYATIRSALALVVIFALVVRGLLELLPVIADGAFARGASGLGALMAMAGVGALAASLWLASANAVREREGEPPRPPRRTYLALFFGLGGMAALGAAESWSAAVALVTFIGFCSTIVGVTMQSVVQIAVDDLHRGRVMSLWIMAGIGSSSIGALAMGATADLLGIEVTLIGAAAAGAALAAIVLLSNR